MAIILSIIGLICAICAIVSALKLVKSCKEANDKLEDLYQAYQTVKLKYDTLKREKDVLVKENAQLKTELEAERLAVKKANVKSVEALPKTEKVTKPRTRKLKTTK